MFLESKRLRRLLITPLAVAFADVLSAALPNTTLVVGSLVQITPSPSGFLESVAIADFNGDGLPDLVTGTNFGNPNVWLNNGTSAPFQGVTATPVGSGDSQQAAYPIDLNNDGHPDIVAIGFNSPIKMYLNNGSANPFQGVAGVSIGGNDPVTGAAFADLDGDGYPDMAVANTNHIPIRLYLSGGRSLADGTQAPIDVGTDLGYGADVKLVDVNGDGLPDLLVSYSVAQAVSTDPSGVVVYLNNGTANPFSGVTPMRLLVGISVGGFAVADVNKDGHPDLIVPTSIGTTATNYVFLNTGSPTRPFMQSETLTSDLNTGSCYSVTVADANGDGLPDALISCDPSTSSVTVSGLIYINNGTADPFASVAPIEIAVAPGGVWGAGGGVAVLAKNQPPSFVIADPAGPAYYPLILDQNPVAVNNLVATSEGQSTDVDVLATATSADGTIDRGSLAVVTSPLHGTARIDPTTYTIIYQPDSGFSGSDSLTYTVKDNLGVISNAATLSVTVQGPPVANNDAPVVVTAQSITVNVLANDTSTGTLDASTLKIVSTPTNGSATIAAGEAGITYQSNPGYVGTDTFQYTVKDNLGALSNVATVTVTVQAPASTSSGGGKGGGGALDLGSLLALAIAGFPLIRSRLRLRPIRRTRRGP